MDVYGRPWMAPGAGLEPATNGLTARRSQLIATKESGATRSTGCRTRRLQLDDRVLILKKPFDNIEAYQLACALTAKWRTEREADLKISRLEHALDARTRELKQSNELLQQQVAERRRLEAQILRNQDLESTLIVAHGE